MSSAGTARRYRSEVTRAAAAVTRSHAGGGRAAGTSASIPAPASVEEVLDLLRARGGRVTSSRRILLEVLFETTGHLSVEDLAAAVQSRAPDVHVSTIYRNVEDLQRLGVVTHTHLGHGPATYQLASLAHAHFVCESCGARIEAPDSMFRSLARSAKSDLGFSIDPHHFAILGRCADCS
jgi:Fur family transcriptional regulator, ferric uptake regulator